MWRGTSAKYPVYLLLFGALSAYVVYVQIVGPFAQEIDVTIQRHENLIAGNSEFYNPWQYRILSHFLLEGFIRVFQELPLNVHAYAPYLIFKLIQTFLIFLVAFLYYRALGIRNDFLVIGGIIILTYNFASSTFKADLSYNMYSDIFFYLLAGYLMLKEKYYWIIVVVFFAALNRETSGMIPVLLLVLSLDFKRWKIARSDMFYAGVGALFAFLLVYFAVRGIYGFKSYQTVALRSPIDFLRYNLTFLRLYPNLIGTWSIIPILALWKFRDWPYHLKLFGAVLIPVWVVIHFIASIAVETRLFLIPQVMVFIPAFLFVIEKQVSAKNVQKIAEERSTE